MLRACALLAVLAFNTCRVSQPQPVPEPPPAPPPTGTVTSPEPSGEPASICDQAYEHLIDMECPAKGGRDGWATTCSTLSAAMLNCILDKDVCDQAHACWE